MSVRQLDTYERILHGINLSRRLGIPVDATAREAGTTLRTTLGYGRQALKRVGGRWMARTSDRLERRMLFYDRKGSYYVVAGSSDAASRISDYHHAMGRFLTTGDASKLRGFAGRYVVAVDGRRHYFLTDPSDVLPLARAGQMGGFDSIY